MRDSINTARLLKLADFLENMPAKKFDFAVVLRVGTKPPMEALAAAEESCGTVACAMGWLPAVFPEQFKWDLAAGSFYDDLGRMDWSATTEFFDLSYDETDFLFDPSVSGLYEGATAKQVAAHIRKFVEEDGIYVS